MTEKKPLLRNYQKEIIARVNEAWKLHRSVMVQMPTGTGKTHVLAHLVNEAPGVILIVAHRVELIEQIRRTVEVFRSFAEAQDDKKVIVESIQTISRRIHALDFTPQLIIIDEAHHALAKTYRILWEKWPEARFLGLTATPCRMNRNGFTDLFDTLISSWSVAEFIRKGVLSVFDYVSIRPSSLEQQLINSLQKRGADGDFQVKEMDEVLNKQPSIERLYRSVQQFAQGKKGIVYAISIDHARRIAAYYNQQGIRTTAIDSRTPKEERRRMVEAFQTGEIQVLVNVDVFSEGFDCPDVEFVQMARPTLSLSKYLQQVGRGLRRSEGKESCMLIDNVGLCRVFGLPVQAWNWERMFRGEQAGKGNATAKEEATASTLRYAACLNETEPPEVDQGLGWVIQHETLLEKLDEWDCRPPSEERTAELRAWQDEETGRWGLKRGRTIRTEAVFITIFDIKESMAAVRFSNYECGLVDENGQTLWKRNCCVSLKINRNHLMDIELEGGERNYLDLYNLKLYLHKPEVKRYGNYELLKVKHLCYSRTQRRYVSQQNYDALIITNKGFLLKITEKIGEVYGLLKGDTENYYRILQWLPDEGAVISDEKNRLYRITTKGQKIFLANGTDETYPTVIERTERQVIREMETEEKKKKQKIFAEQRNAIPYQSGFKWGLKVGERIIVPPIYRQVCLPVGKYCAVEKNYSQWGIITIDGTILVEPKYTEVCIDANGTARLTQVTGKKITVKLR